MWMGLIQSVEGVKRKHQVFWEKEFYHKTSIKMLCDRLLRDAGVVNMSRKLRASSPLSNNHLPTPKRRGRGKHPLNPGRGALS
uniref:Uncharacterized protein n=1 Tax=Cercocebus atys TaxID=9531 RepID=A0A2K5KMC9_CERAT